MDDEPLDLPAHPAPPARPALPVLGMVAPVALAVVLYAVTRSPYCLLFALLGPLLAGTAVLDGRIGARRRVRRERATHAAALEALAIALDARLAARRVALEAADPQPAVLAADPSRWRSRPARGALVLGTADASVERLIRGTPQDDRERALVAASRTVRGAPFTVPAGTTVAACGPSPVVDAFARAVAVSRARCEGVPLPAEVVPHEHAAAHDLVVRVDTVGRAVAVHAAGPAAGAEGRVFRPALVTAAALAAVEGGLAASALPLAALLALPATGGVLPAAFATDEDERALPVDLAADGPHAVVVGTTGSGKSALLTAWLLALAAAHAPDEVALLLVDCKGGSAFDPLAPLPHVAGVVTDLEPDQVLRTVTGLDAELRRREAVLRAASVSDATAAGLSRLVVAVDEYRALTERAPQLAAVFADVAARGRSLGVHLVLCTQRATGAVRDELLANCGLRIGLRMRDAADSTALLGRPDAARLRGTGSAIVSADGEVRRIRVADTTPEAVADGVRAVGERWRGRRCAVPWHPPLPERIESVTAPAAGAVALGLLDLPAEQRQPVLAWDPRTHASLVVIGAPGSGRTNAIAVAAAALGAGVTAPDGAALWDALEQDEVPLVVDDLEALLDALGPAHATAALERLAVRLRRRAAPTVLALRGPAARSGLPVRPVVQLAERTLLLALPPDDRLALGGRREHADLRWPPGRGEWEGAVAQVVLASAPAPIAPADAAEPFAIDGRAWLLVSGAPADRAAQLAAAGVEAAAAPGEHGVWTVSPSGWQSDWSRLGRLQAELPVLIDRLQPSDVRAVTGRGGLLPPVSGPDDVVLVPPGAAPHRVRLPRAP